MTQPKQIGRYIVQRLLGEGAMGSVYKAVDPAIKRTVAIKTIKVDTSRSQEEQDEFLQRFFQEAQISGNLNHPNIVSIYDIGDEDGTPYLALEFVEGKTLNQLIKGSVRPGFESLAKAIVQIANALTFAHGKGIVHRDLKPANIMITPEGEAKIMDFGIAKMSGSNLTQTGIFLGTPSYSSPEQVKEGRVDHRSDIFSLGILAHEVLTGFNPFPGKSISTILYKIANEDPEPPPNLKDLPLNLDCWQKVFRHVLEKNPEKRCQNASKFGQMLLECIQLSTSTSKELSGFFDDGPNTVKQSIGVNKRIERSDFEKEKTKLSQASIRKRKSRLGLWLTLALCSICITFLALDYFKVIPQGQRVSQFFPQSIRTRFFPPDEIQKIIHITSTPQDAKIFINELETDPTPLDYTFIGTPGTEVTIAIKKDGYEAFQQSYILDSKEDLNVNAKLMASPIMAKISSIPAGATITIDGKSAGQAPVSFSFQRDRTYEISYKLTGHQTKRLQFDTEKDLIQKLIVKMEKVTPPGQIKIKSDFSDLNIQINGKTQKKTATLPSGSYRVQLSAPSVFYRETRTIQVESGKTSTLSTPATVTIELIDFANPTLFGVVYIDGKKVDDTPISNTKISRGLHSFKFLDGNGNIMHQEDKEVLDDGTKILAPD